MEPEASPATEINNALSPAQAPVCPVAHAAPAHKRFLDADDELVLPLHKRLITQYAKDVYGTTELRLFYDDKEISFDEPELFGFGETLAQQSRFIARTATQWAKDQPWPRIQGLLEQLIEEGILRYAEDAPAGDGDTAARTTQDGVRASPLPPAETHVARTWLDCEAITRELTGRALETGYLELVVPIFRVVHMAMDADGRQVGEANVFPKALRLDVPTNWRACIYAGTRYLDERPMNVTALKAMRAHWGQMMAAILVMREGYLRRFPEARAGWTVGHLERLSTAILALPTYVLMRANSDVANGALHPALSSLFRVTDGVRMTMHQMLFIPIGEPTVLPDAPMNAQTLLDYAERNYSFHSEFGVCAGPKAMMEEFLAVLIDGVPARNADAVVLEPAVKAALNDVEAAIDYGLHGLQAYAAVFSLFPIMTRAYERLSAIMQAWHAAGGSPAVTAFADRLRGIMESLKTATYLGAEQWRVDRETVYADMYRQCGKGLRIPEHPQSLTQRMAPHRDAQMPAVAYQLHAILLRHFNGTVKDAQSLETLLGCIVDYLSQVQALLGVACDTQRHINALLGRTPPLRPFTAADIDIHIALRGPEHRRVPDLCAELEALLGVTLVVAQDHIEITETVPAAPL